MGAPHVAIVGLPGVGKSSVAGRLGERLDLEVIDLDTEIEGVAGRPITEIFETEGEDGFRDLEERRLAALVDVEHPARLVCCGGGVVLRGANRLRLRERTRCVWLDARVEVLVERLWSDRGDRPLLAVAADRDSLRARLELLREERAAWYDEVCVARLDVSDSTLDEVVEVLVEVLG